MALPISAQGHVAPASTSNSTAPNHPKVVAPPVVYGLTPNSGPTLGGTSVTIYGTGFTGATNVKFGTVSTTCGGGFFVVSDTQIFASAPAGSAGTVDVVVVGPGGSSATGAQDKFSYSAPAAPVVYGLSPNSGPTPGGTIVSIFGTGFSTATRVFFGAVPAFAFGASDTLLTVSSPASTAGTFDVTVVNATSTSATNNQDKFTYAAPGAPVVRAVAPNSSTASGGVPVSIVGSGFSNATDVHFGGTDLGPGQISVADDNHIFVTAPAGTAATIVDVKVTTSVGTSAIVNADKFSYLAPAAPVVRAIVTSSGPAIGGTQIQVLGSGFSGATTVKFGANAGTNLLVFDDGNLAVTSPAGAVATVDVTVTTPHGTSATSAADHFTYMATPVPVIYAVTPNNGTTSGGNVISIIGSGFTGMTSVHFGATLATNNLSIFGDGQISVSAPAHAIGTIDVTVTTPGGTSSTNLGDKYTYKTPPNPVVSSVNPNHGSPTGGDSIELFGVGFTGATAVHFGGVAATTFSAFVDTEMSVTAPAGTNGMTVDITVTTPVGTSSVSNADKFTWVTPPVPAVTGISPSTGPETGGTTVWISGSGFSGAFSVSFGPNPTFSFQVIDDNVIVANRSPAGSVGAVDITVTTGGGTSATGSADLFTYTAAPAPTVTSVGPSSGTASGGTTVYVSGTGLTGATTVNFGGTSAGFLVIDDNVIRASSPSGTASTTVDITVVGPGGTSVTSLNDKFTYTAAVPPAVPIVTAVSPNTGTAAGGSTSIFVSGSHFTGATTVNFGANAAFFVTISDDLINVTVAPAGVVGMVDVTVVSGAGTSTLSANDKYTYVAAPAPAVTVVSPNTGPAAGGTTVWITGTGLNAATGVTFGGTAGVIVTNPSDNLLSVTSPVHAVGTVDVVVTTPGGTTPVTANDHFVYGGPVPGGLHVYGVAPNHGSVAGGAVANRPAMPAKPAAGGGGNFIEIDGLGFTGATAVKFGSVASPDVIPSSDTQLIAQDPGGIAGTVDVTVTVGASTSPGSNADKFTFTPVAKPVVSGVDPNQGPTIGSTGVTIYGTGFLGTTSVHFGSNLASAFFVFNDTSVSATGPPGALGTVDVTVTTAGGTSTTGNADKFTYVAPPTPEVDAVDPSSGTTLGGTTVSIYGSGLSGATGVLFGTALVFPSFGSDTQVVAQSPPGTVGTVDVTVTSPGGTSATSNADKFHYVAPSTPVVDAVAPNRGGTAGARLVRIFGTGLSGTTNVHFGATAASTIGIANDGEVDVTSPAGSAGTVDVTVTTPGGTSATGAGDKYTYFVAPAPTVTAVSPSSGAPGSVVFITGTGFSDVTSVLFGSACVFNFFVPFGISDTSLEAFAPSGPTGTVDVTVVSPDGTSTISANDQFTYTAPSVPTVTYVAPASGPSGGGTIVQITGTGLAAATSVMFGSVPALPVRKGRVPYAPGPPSGNFSVIDDNLISAQSPAEAVATVDIRVVSPGGTSAITSADHFAYGPTPVPSVTAVSPNSGPSGGGDSVFLTGSGFQGATQIHFGSTVLTPCVFFFGPFVQGGSSPTIETANPAASPRMAIPTQVPIHDPKHPGAKRFATVLTPSIGHPLLTGPGARTSSAARRGPLAPFPCTNGFVVISDNLIQLTSPAGPIGTVDITVTTAGGTSPMTAADHYTYVTTPAPTISSVSPSTGPSGGGTTVYVSGSHLKNVSAVHFGSVAGTLTTDPFIFPFTTGDSLVVALSPANTGTVHVTVTTAGGTSATSAADQFTYTASPVPSVTGLAPGSGPIGTEVFITGSGFLGTSAVDFGAVPAIHSHGARTAAQTAASGGPHGFNVVSDTLIDVFAPSHPVGLVDVTVVTAGGTSSSSASDRFTYTASPPPAVTAVGPSSGTAGIAVYVTGTGFTAASAVNFGSTAATAFAVLSDSLIHATSPAGSGVVDIRVTTPGGTSAATSADQFAYGAALPPTVTSVVPNSGSPAGGTPVTIIGTNFSGVSAVHFGATAAAGFTVNSPTQISATSPAGSGTVDVTVTTPGGTSVTSAADQFTFGRKGAAQSGTQPPAGRSGIKPAPPQGPGPRTDAGSQAGNQAGRTPAGTSSVNAPLTSAQATPLVQWLASVVQALFRVWLLLLQ